MIRHVVASLMLCFCLNAWAGDHLEPEESIFSGNNLVDTYERQLLNYFGDFYRNGVILRLISIPSFSEEYALGIVKENNRYYVTYQKPKRQLWAYQMELPFRLNQLDELKKSANLTIIDYENRLKEITKDYPENPMEMPKISCEKEINVELALDIYNIWMNMLLQTKYSAKPGLGVDGQTYHFSAPIKNMFLNYAGKVWSPEPKTKTGKLVEISDLMVDYCLKSDEEKTEKLLKKKVKILKKRI